MAQVLPAERDLRRVIGDADGAGDRQVVAQIAVRRALLVHRYAYFWRSSNLHSYGGRIRRPKPSADSDGRYYGHDHDQPDPAFQEWQNVL